MDVLTIEQRKLFVNDLYDWCESTAVGNHDGEIIWTDEWTNGLSHILNNLFPDAHCIDVLLTTNLDKVPFYINVQPSISDKFIAAVLFGNDVDSEYVQIGRYKVELDTKVFRDFTPAQVTEIILYSVHKILDYNLVKQIRRGISAAMIETNNSSARDGYIRIKEMKEASELFRYAILAFISEVTPMGNLKFEDNIEWLNDYPNMKVLDGVEVFRTVLDKCAPGGFLSDLSQHPAIKIFDWLFKVYLEPGLISNSVVYTLQQAKKITGSVLNIREIDRTIESINGISRAAMVDKVHLQESVNTVLEGFSLFKSLKMNGLRSIEDDLYEYRIRVKNCEEEEEAMYILRQINTRMSILDDYMRNTEISDRERARWEDVIDSYRNIRADLGKKKLGPKKQYGIFIDYDKIDQIE